MKNFDMIRAWKSDKYRASLSEEQLKDLPENPAGELDESQLDKISGGCVIGSLSPSTPVRISTKSCATTKWNGCLAPNTNTNNSAFDYDGSLLRG